MKALRFFLILLLPILLIFFGCAHYQKIAMVEKNNVYIGQVQETNIIHQHAPLFLAHNYTDTYNRIGRPSARYDKKGREQIYVDTYNPVIYYLRRNFSTKNGLYTNLIYRVHFPKVPFSLIPFHLTAGKNVGLMIVITIDSTKKPVLITTVHTCGCFRTIVPTSYLPQDALPLKWKEKPIRVYGEKLPGRLDYSNIENPKLLIHLKPGIHRVMNMEIVDEQELRKSPRFTLIPTPMKHVRELEQIPLDNGTTSFYHKKGVLKGHVKGSVKIWESILLSLPSLDLFVGADKIYADQKETGNRFYTSLKPWNREASDMWNFAEFLEFWGWRL